MMNKDQYEKGLAVRKEVMGEEFVEQAFKNATEFTLPLQEMVTENCWGTVWNRDGLPKSTRSLVTIAMLVALRATTELKGHVRGALRNGCSVEEIQEVLLQALVYCGAPASVEAFRAANEVIAEWKKQHG